MTETAGFVDLQVNGFLGVDFSTENLSEKDFLHASAELLDRGTAAFLPTIITSSEATYKRVLPMIAKIISRPEHKNKLPGLHLEGPFISPEPGAVGAHNPDFVKTPSVDFLKKLIDWSEGKIRLLTIAAEREGADKLAEFAVENGIAVSIGHQMAGEKDIRRLADAGATLITHLGNGMPNMIHRHNNPLWPLLAEDRLTAMIITDGHHLPAPLIKTILRAKGPEKVIVTSDASSLAGCPPGKYKSMGNDVVIEENGLLHNPAKGCMVGSSASMLVCVNHLASLGLLDERDIMRVCLENPLKIAGLSKSDLQSDHHVRHDKVSGKFELVLGK